MESEIVKAVDREKMEEYNKEDRNTNLSEEELEWERRRRARMQRMKLEKEKELRKQSLIKRAIPVAVIVLFLGIVSIVTLVGKSAKKNPDVNDAGDTVIVQDEVVKAPESEETEESSAAEPDSQEATAFPGQVTVPQTGSVGNTTNTTVPNIAMGGEGVYEANTTSATGAPPGEVDSTNVVFIDLESGNILAQRGYKQVVNPASMTKVLTLLVAAEHVTDLEDTFTITIDITDYSYVNDCSNVGFEVGETVTVRDLLYGTILPSGGDAAVGLATYVAGSHEAFVELMNDKLEQLGLSETAHFTNCVGIYDENHHCSVYDMAMIMEAALDNDLCREVLGARTYTTSTTLQHPEGITISNWFIRRIEDKDTGGEILGAKTGYVNESGSCAVSYGVDASGKGYVCATTGAHSSWRCIYDHVALYKAYAKK